MRAQEHACSGCDPHEASWDAAPAWWRGLDILGPERKFVAVNDRQVPYTPLAELFAYDSCQRTVLSLGNVGDAQSFRVHFIARAKRRDNGNASAEGRFNEVKLAGH